MARSGLQPRGAYSYSKLGIKYEYCNKSGIRVPNLAGEYHSVLRQYWETHGLGRQCLLVSESKRVKMLMEEIYPGVSFTTADLYYELLGNEECDKPDVVWDVCLRPDKDLFPELFQSIICHALLEHVIAPTIAIRNMFTLLAKDSFLYGLTHTPSFPVHRYPRDYFRFHQDYFEDLPSHLLKLYCLKVELMELYSKEGVVIFAYKKLSE